MSVLHKPFPFSMVTKGPGHLLLSIYLLASIHGHGPFMEKTLISATLNICHTKTIRDTVTKICSGLNHIIKHCMLISRGSALNTSDVIDETVTIFSYCGGFISITGVLFTGET